MKPRKLRFDARTSFTTAVSGIEFDMLRAWVTIGDRQVRLTALLHSLLYLLAQNPGVVVTRQAILDALWGPESDNAASLVDVHIGKLRRLLNDDARHPKYIETIAGQGYRFIPAAGHRALPAQRQRREA